MLHKNTYLQITEHLAQYGVFCKSFRPNNNGDDDSSSYPSCFISAAWGDMDIEFRLVACVHDSSANILGIKFQPDLNNRDEKVFFSITVMSEYENFIHDYMHKHGFYKDLSFIYAINYNLPMNTDYTIIVGPDTLFLMTGHFIYTSAGYVINDHSERPLVHLSADIMSPRYDYFKQEKLIMKLQHDGITIVSLELKPAIKDKDAIKLKLFQSLVLYYMSKTGFKIDNLEIDDILALSYDDLVRQITLQKMVDI